eukprot:gene10623-12300_t
MKKFMSSNLAQSFSTNFQSVTDLAKQSLSKTSITRLDDVSGGPHNPSLTGSASDQAAHAIAPDDNSQEVKLLRSQVEALKIKNTLLAKEIEETKSGAPPGGSRMSEDSEMEIQRLASLVTHLQSELEESKHAAKGFAPAAAESGPSSTSEQEVQRLNALVAQLQSEMKSHTTAADAAAQVHTKTLSELRAKFAESEAAGSQVATLALELQAARRRAEEAEGAVQKLVNDSKASMAVEQLRADKAEATALKLTQKCDGAEKLAAKFEQSLAEVKTELNITQRKLNGATERIVLMTEEQHEASLVIKRFAEVEAEMAELHEQQLVADLKVREQMAEVDRHKQQAARSQAMYDQLRAKLEKFSARKQEMERQYSQVQARAEAAEGEVKQLQSMLEDRTDAGPVHTETTPAPSVFAVPAASIRDVQSATPSPQQNKRDPVVISGGLVSSPKPEPVVPVSQLEELVGDAAEADGLRLALEEARSEVTQLRTRIVAHSLASQAGMGHRSSSSSHGGAAPPLSQQTSHRESGQNTVCPSPKPDMFDSVCQTAFGLGVEVPATTSQHLQTPVLSPVSNSGCQSDGSALPYGQQPLGTDAVLQYEEAVEKEQVEALVGGLVVDLQALDASMDSLTEQLALKQSELDKVEAARQALEYQVASMMQMDGKENDELGSLGGREVDPHAGMKQMDGKQNNEVGSLGGGKVDPHAGGLAEQLGQARMELEEAKAEKAVLEQRVLQLTEVRPSGEEVAGAAATNALPVIVAGCVAVRQASAGKPAPPPDASSASESPVAEATVLGTNPVFEPEAGNEAHLEAAGNQWVQEKAVLEAQLRELKAENERWSDERPALQDKLEATSNQWVQEKAVLEAQLREFKAMNERWSDERPALQDKLEAASNQWVQEKAVLEAQLREFKAEHEQWSDGQSSLREKLEALEQERERWSMEKTALAKKVSALEACERRSLERSFQSAKSRDGTDVGSALAVGADGYEETATLRQELSGLKAKLQELGRAHILLREERGALEAKLKDMEKGTSTAKLQSKVEILEKKLDQVFGLRSSLELKVQGLEAEKASLESQLKDAAGGGEPSAGTASQQAVSARLELKVHELEAEKASLERQLTDAAGGGEPSASIASQQEANARLELKVQELEADKASLESQLKDAAGGGEPSGDTASQLQATIARLEAQRLALDGEKLQWVGERSVFEDKVKELEAKEHSYQLLVSELQEQVQSMEDEMRQSVVEKSSLEVKLLELQAAVDGKLQAALEEHLDRVGAERAAWAEEKFALESQVTGWAEEKLALESQITELEGLHGQGSEKVSSLAQKVQEMEARLAQKFQEMEGLVSERVAWAEEKLALESQVTELVGLHGQGSEEVSSLAQKVQEMEASLAQKVQEMEGVVSERVAWAEEKFALESQVTELVGLHGQGSEEVSSLAQKVQEMEASLAQKVQEMEGLVAERSSLHARMADLEQMNKQSEEEVDRFKSLVEGNMDNLSHLTGRVGTLEAEHGQWADERAEFDALLEGLEGEKALLENQKSVLEKQLREAQAQCAASSATGLKLQSCISELESTMEVLACKNSELQAMLVQSEDAGGQSATEMSSLLAKVAALESAHSVWLEESTGIESKVVLLEEGRTGLEIKVRLLEEERTGLESKVCLLEEERTALESKVCLLEEGKAEAEELFERKQGEHEAKASVLQTKVVELEEEVGRCGEDKCGQQAQIVELQECLDSITQAKAVLDASITNLKDELVLLTDGHSNLEARLSEVERERDTLREEHATLREQLGNAEALTLDLQCLAPLVDVLEKEKADWLKAQAELQIRVDDYDCLQSTFNEEMARLQKTQVELQVKADDYDRLQSAFNEEMARFQESQANAESQIVDLLEMKVVWEECQAVAQAHNDEHALAQAAWKEQAARMEERLKESQAVAQAHTDEHALAQGAWKEQVARMEERLYELESERSCWGENVGALEAKLEARDTDASLWESAREELEAKLEAKDTDASLWESAREELEAKFDAKDTEARTLQSSIDRLEAELSSDRSIREELEAKLDAKDTEARTLQSSIDRLEAELSSDRSIREELEAKLDAKDTEARTLQSSIDRLEAELSSDRSIREELEAKLDAKDTEARTLQSSIDRLEAELSSDRSIREELEAKLDAKDTEARFLQSSIDELEAELSSGRRSREELDARSSSRHEEGASWQEARAQLEEKICSLQQESSSWQEASAALVLQVQNLEQGLSSAREEGCKRLEGEPSIPSPCSQVECLEAEVVRLKGVLEQEQARWMDESSLILGQMAAKAVSSIMAASRMVFCNLVVGIVRSCQQRARAWSWLTQEAELVKWEVDTANLATLAAADAADTEADVDAELLELSGIKSPREAHQARDVLFSSLRLHLVMLKDESEKQQTQLKEQAEMIKKYAAQLQSQTEGESAVGVALGDDSERHQTQLKEQAEMMKKYDARLQSQTEGAYESEVKKQQEELEECKGELKKARDELCDSLEMLERHKEQVKYLEAELARQYTEVGGMRADSPQGALSRVVSKNQLGGSERPSEGGSASNTLPRASQDT